MHEFWKSLNANVFSLQQQQHQPMDIDDKNKSIYCLHFYWLLIPSLRYSFSRTLMQSQSTVSREPIQI